MKINQKIFKRERSRGLTLVELLVVIVILSLVTAATIPLMQPATAERRIREGSRMVATVMANAQARALATGRPVGVWFQRLPYTESEFNPQDLVNPQNGLADQPAHFAIEMFLCEVPSPFTGETSQASAQIGQTSPPSQNERQVALWEGPPGGTPTPLPPKTIRNGDRIRFNYRGHYYTIDGTVDNEGYLTGGTFKITKLQNQQWPQIVGTSPYQIYRQPRKTADAPAQMPVGTVVDLEWSGLSSGWFGFLVNPPSPAQTKLAPKQPVIVMFGPSGNLDSVYWGLKGINAPNDDRGVLTRQEPISPLFLLIGQPAGDDAVTRGKKNHINFDHVWIAINPQSGLVTTSEVGSEFDVETGNYANDTSAEIDASRAFAKSAQNMGGR